MQRADLNSTLLDAATYRDQLAVLEVKFRSGAIYHYFAVPAQTFEELLRAESHGAYFNHHIRNRFACAKIQPAKPVAVQAPTEPHRQPKSDLCQHCPLER